MAKKTTTTRGRGRPRTGLRPGESVRDYPHITVRLPEPLMLLLRGLADVRGVPVWRLVLDVIDHYLGTLTADERKAVTNRARRLRREWDARARD